jgi:hypothetical protein
MAASAFLFYKVSRHRAPEGLLPKVRRWHNCRSGWIPIEASDERES